MENCKYNYETDGLLVRIVDTEKNWKDSVDYCKQFGEELAPINNQKRLNDTLDQLEGCYKTDVDGVNDTVEGRPINKYRIGLSVKNQIGFWSDGSSLDFVEQNGLFYKNLALIKDGNSFFIRRDYSNQILFDRYINDVKPLNFLCSKNKPVSTQTLVNAISVGFFILLLDFFHIFYLKEAKRN